MADLMFNFSCGLKTDDPRHTIGGRKSNDPWVVSLGATSIEKIPKISASGRNFLDPLFEKGPYRRKRRYFVPNSNYKVRFFQSFKPLPPLFHQKAEPHRFYQLRWPLTSNIPTCFNEEN